MRKSVITLICLLLFFTQNIFAQMPSAEERSVQLSATVQTNPPQIQLTWKSDPTATKYVVYRKTLAAESWGVALDTLAGSATQYLDQNVQIGVGYEYAFFKEDFAPRVDTVFVQAGTQVNFTINDMYGIGLCCSFGFGAYEVENCGSIQAQGADFGNTQSTIFEVCDDGSGGSDVIITLKTDMFENSTSWVLTNNATGATILNSGFVGQFVKPRPEYGFIYASIELPPIEDRGKILLLVQDNLVADLEEAIHQLQLDFVGDGYQVLTEAIDPNDSPNNVRTVIQNLYSQHPELNSVFILGHIPIAYSGDIFPDTHFELRGAYPADVFYGEMEGTWSDQNVNNTSANFPIYHNTPGDGRFDQDAIPTGTVELAVGRVDFFDMPAFPSPADTLIKNYLQKNHAFKTRAINPVRRALVDDNFMQSFAAPAASGYRNFAPMFGADSIHQLDYFSTMENKSYLWSYGCGSGSIVSSQGIGSTTDFVTSNLQSVFTMLFGSQFGNWAYPDNFLRAPLASGQTLTNVWAGNPPWTFHHMAMGYPIGYSTLKTQNGLNGLYLGNGPQLVHVALMGDPTLRMHNVAPSKKITFIPTNTAVEITWDEPEDEDIYGYHLYRSDDWMGKYERINADVLTDTFFTDTMPLTGENWYMVRTIKLENTASGSYFNLSLGKIDSIFFSPAIPLVAAFDANETTVCAGDTILFNNISTGSILNYEWTFAGGDPPTSTAENPEVTYDSKGTFDVSLKVTDAFGEATKIKSEYIVIDSLPIADFSYTIDNGTVSITNNSSDVNDYLWEFGDGNTSQADGNISHTYDASGIFTIVLTASNDCGTVDFSQEVNITITSLEDLEKVNQISIFPNPVDEVLMIDFGKTKTENLQLEIVNTIGQTVISRQINSPKSVEEINVTSLSKGIYFVKITGGAAEFVKRIVVE
ncbi:MAG: PKD domain-containing protein [Bacteroidota bacterium]